MRAVVQRVRESRVTVGEKVTGEIGKGLVVLIGVEDVYKRQWHWLPGTFISSSQEMM